MEDVGLDDLCRFATRPLAFIARYLRRRLVAHVVIVTAVLAAVGCSVTTQYGVKTLVDALASPAHGGSAVWFAFILLVSLIAADNLLWRVASWIANDAFVKVTGDLRSDLFRHLTGHAPSYFQDRLPGMLTSRITATSNAIFTIENMFVWNVLPPCVATLGAIILLLSVSVPMAVTLGLIAGVLVVAMFRFAAAGRPLHHDFADKASTVDGEMVDVIGNLPMVRAFCGIRREHSRFDQAVDREMSSRRRSLFYLEKLRLSHALITITLTICLLAWAIMLWQRGGMSVLHATRDLAVALVDVTQHFARLSEALLTLLLPHELRDHPEAVPLQRRGARVMFQDVTFAYREGHPVFEDFSLELEPDQRVGLVGPSGGGKSTLFTLLQRFYDVQEGRILIDGQDISMVTQDSLRAAISVVPQDTSLFHRSVMENIRYGRPDATDEEVLQAAVAARCEFIEALPEGFATKVGDRGLRLSGGQRQRIAIARGFLKKAPILLLDEATSALDSESEEAIREALERLMRGRTVLAIAHRLSTLRSFDRIVVLQAGRIVQDGPPDALIRREGIYRELVMREMSRLGKQAA